MTPHTPIQLATSAIRQHDPDRLRSVLSDHPELTNDTSLFMTAGFEDAACIAVLLDAGVDIELIDPYWGSSALTEAAGNAKLANIELLLERGAKVDGPLTAPKTALIAAAKNGALDAARLLCEAGADVDRDSLTFPHSALNVAEELAAIDDQGHAAVAEYLRSRGATKPWDYERSDDFWDGATGELTTRFVETSLGLVCATPVLEKKSKHATTVIRRARHGWKAIFQTVFTSGLTSQGAECEVGVSLTSRWPLHRSALADDLFRRPANFLAGLSERLLAGGKLEHGDLLGREDELVAGLPWPGDFQQWLVVKHESFEQRRAEVRGTLPVVLLLVPFLEKKPLKPGADARAKADAKAAVKWEKPAAKGGKNCLVVPLCYDAPWLNGSWF